MRPHHVKIPNQFSKHNIQKVLSKKNIRQENRKTNYWPSTTISKSKRRKTLIPGNTLQKHNNGKKILPENKASKSLQEFF